MSKSYPIFVAVIMLIMAVLACCPEPPTPIVKTAVPGEAGESREPATEVPGTQVPIGSSRSNPAPQGSEVEIGDITLAVQGVMRPADDVVAEANMFNDEPAEGNEYLMIEITITCNKGTDETRRNWSVSVSEPRRRLLRSSVSKTGLLTRSSGI